MAAGDVATRTRAMGNGASTSGRGHHSSQQGGYAVGSRVVCQATFDGTAHAADIIEVKQGEAEPYYIHYVDCDKRLDEWVSAERLRPLSAGGVGPGAVFPRLASVPSLSAADIGADGQKITRRYKRKFDEKYHVAPDMNDLTPMDQAAEREHEEKTKIKNVEVIELGKYEIDTWYFSPYPEPYNSVKKLYICEFCLKYFKKKKTLLRHSAKCDLTHPPGDEIYRSPPRRGPDPDNCVTDPTIAVFEVDGKKNKIYCQSLCLMSKLFLDHKTLYYDVDPFLFYILCEERHGKYHIVGYFSKEKQSVDGYNLACILTLPPYQRKGYGTFQQAFSYELSKKEGKLGTPERPLSDLGQVSYRSYWTRTLLDVLYEQRNASLADLSALTAIRSDDVVKTLDALGCIKYWKGDHIVVVPQSVYEDHQRTREAKKMLGIDVSRLHWAPYVQTGTATGRR